MRTEGTEGGVGELERHIRRRGGKYRYMIPGAMGNIASAKDKILRKEKTYKFSALGEYR